MRWMMVVLMSVGCGGATKVMAPEGEVPQVGPCAGSENWLTLAYGKDDPSGEGASEAFGTVPPCLDEEGNDLECDRVVPRFVVNSDHVADRLYDVMVYRERDEHLDVIKFVYTAPSEERCAANVVREDVLTVGPWVVARIGVRIRGYGSEGCYLEGMSTALAFADAKTGAFAGIVQCISEEPATPRYAGGRVIVDGCRGETPSFSDAELASCKP